MERFHSGRTFSTTRAFLSQYIVLAIFSWNYVKATTPYLHTPTYFQWCGQPDMKTLQLFTPGTCVDSQGRVVGSPAGSSRYPRTWDMTFGLPTGLCGGGFYNTTLYNCYFQLGKVNLAGTKPDGPYGKWLLPPDSFVVRLWAFESLSVLAPGYSGVPDIPKHPTLGNATPIACGSILTEPNLPPCKSPRWKGRAVHQ
jgi:hypothetical protein